jgi:NAD(P)-dependent dehydrogenase (short-subunit alcohol dehydrogenase family)
MNGCQDKVVGITGVSNGIGAALADELGGRRARVVLAARWREALEAVAKRKVGAEVVPTDVTQRSEAEPVRDGVLARFESSMVPSKTGMWRTTGGRYDCFRSIVAARGGAVAVAPCAWAESSAF